MITSDEVLSDREQPGSVLFVGGGVIALELGHVYARAGTKVTILEVLRRLLPALDEDAVEQIRQESARIGIDVHTGVKVLRVEKANNQLSTIFATNGKEQAVVSDRVVNGAGRIANVDYLDLDAGRVAHDNFRISVDEYLRSTSNPAVLLAATCSQARRSFRPSPLTRGRSWAQTSSRARSTSLTMRAFLPPSTPCRRSLPSGSPRRKPRRRA